MKEPIITLQQAMKQAGYIEPTLKQLKESAERMTECIHSPTGHPYGHPIFPCAWPTCPRGVQAPTWVVAAPSPGISPGTQYTRQKHREGADTYYTWNRND